MLTKSQAIEFAKKFNWTGKDAERAFNSANINFAEADEKILLEAMAIFAGPELLERQRLQGAQKAQVTKKKKYIRDIELHFSSQTKEYEENLQKERSKFVGVIGQLYKFGKFFGLRDPWIEALLETYDEHQEIA
jgi:hypothetical protein